MSNDRFAVIIGSVWLVATLVVAVVFFPEYLSH